MEVLQNWKSYLAIKEVLLCLKSQLGGGDRQIISLTWTIQKNKSVYDICERYTPPLWFFTPHPPHPAPNHFKTKVILILNEG